MKLSLLLRIWGILASTTCLGQGSDPANVIGGGLAPVYHDMHMNVLYPNAAMDTGPEGTVILGVTVDTLCQVKEKRIVQDIGMGCGQAALVGVDKDFELGLMKRFNFRCRVGEMLMPVRFEQND